jgi:hypothetical protein
MQVMNMGTLRLHCTDDDLANVDRVASAVIEAAKASMGTTPPGVQQLITHKEHK